MLEKLNNIRNRADRLGTIIVFAVSTFNTVTEDLSINSKIGRILSSFLAGVAMVYTGVFLAGGGIVGLLAIATITSTLSYFSKIINDVYFSTRINRRNKEELYYV